MSLPVKGYECRLRVILAEIKLKDSNFKQENFAKELGISRTTLYSIINEKSLPSFDVAYSIADRLNMKIEDIWIRI
ncbi:MAG: helix-turn-helix domain-containing protein [Bacillaceae bacterium]|nr:helix-turn-helix domain-containing protein [Bacillaceae bacterium]